MRYAFGTLLARGANIGSIVSGLVGSSDMQVTAGSGMSVSVSVGEAWINGTSVSTQGGYACRITSSTSLAISASNESNPRIETIIAQVTDKSYAGGTETFSVSVVVGTATSGATLANKLGHGDVPASSLVLAYVLVPAKAVSIVSGDIENVAARLGTGNVAMAYRKAALKVKNATFTIIPVDTVIADPGALIKEGAYVVPSTGYYQVDAQCTILGAAGQAMSVAIYVEAAARATGQLGAVAVASFVTSVATAIVKCVAGEKITARLYQENTSAAEVPLEPLEEKYNFLHVVRVA